MKPFIIIVVTATYVDKISVTAPMLAELDGTRPKFRPNAAPIWKT
jgi:hypothetical protein